MFLVGKFGNNQYMEKMILPLGNGLGLYEKDKLCVSIIDSSGNKRVGGKQIKSINKAFFLPIIRGFTFFFLGIYLYFSSFVLSQDLDSRPENEKNKSFKIAKNITVASSFLVIVATAVAAFLYGLIVLAYLPNLLFAKAFPYYENYYFRALIISLLRFCFIYLSLALVRLLPFSNGLYGFNGAGNVYLSGKEDLLRPRTYPLNYLNFVLNVFLFSTFVISLISVHIFWPINTVINLVIFLSCIPIIYEILRFATHSKVTFLRDAAIVTNWLVSTRPNTTHNEVLSMSINELTNYDNFEAIENDRVSMSGLFAELETKLKQSDKYEESDRDWIIATVLQKNRAEIKLVRSVSAKEYREIMRACERRAKGEPLSNIFGFVEFYGLRFDVNKKVLSPRMETEILVEEAIKKINEFELKNVLDLCTGSGAIAIAIKKYTNARVYASDISKQALAIASNNARKNEVKIDFCQSDLFKSLKKGKKYDIIVSNPPYIKSGDLEKLDVEVKKYDPRLALDGGEDGLDFYRRIIEDSKSKLTKKGWLLFEVGQGQADIVSEMMQKSGFDNVQAVKDYNKIERVIYGRYSK